MSQQTFYAIRDVTRITTLSDSSIWRLVREGKFPQPTRLSERRHVWTVEQVAEWIEAKKRGEPQASPG